MQKIVFYDLETGGLNAYKHPIIQIAAAAATYPEYEIIDTFEVKCQFNPKECSEKALEINSYDPEVWEREAVPMHKAIARFSSFMNPHKTIQMTSKAGKPYYVARGSGYNNVTFDDNFLRHAYKDAGAFLAMNYRTLDVLQLAAWKLGNEGLENLKLVTVAKHLGVEIEGAHDALVDVLMTAAVAARLDVGADLTISDYAQEKMSKDSQVTE